MSISVADSLALASRCFNERKLLLAQEHVLHILSVEPNHAQALHLLGLITHLQGNPGQAIAHLQKAVSLDPSHADAWRHLGDVYAATEEFRASLAPYQQALQLRPYAPQTYNQLGAALLRLRQCSWAARCFQEAVRLDPSYAAGHYNLGIALTEEGRLPEAAEAFEQALRLEPNNSQATLSLGLLLHRAGDLDRAAAYYRRTLRLNPACVDASKGVAIIFKEQGLFDEAIRAFRHTLELQPDHAIAYANLSEFAAEGRLQFTPDELEQIQCLATSKQRSPSDRSLCYFALGRVFNRQGAYDQAFACFQHANDLRRKLLEGENTAFDAREQQARVEAIVAYYDSTYFERVKGWGNQSAAPIFILGMPRSGSTLVEQILASHPQAIGTGEVGEIPEFFARWEARASAGRTRAGLSGDHWAAPPILLDEAAAQRQAAEFLALAAQTGAERITVKNLANHFYVGLIATLFPGARIIYCRREPLDVCLSCYFQNFESADFAWSLADIGFYYRRYANLMDHWRRVLPAPIHEVSYEELVQDQEKVTRALLAYCGLNWDERCLAYFKTRRAVRTASALQVRQPLFKGAIGRWKFYRAHLGPLFAALGLPAPGPTPLPPATPAELTPPVPLT
jgi:tetratricopeptide (TPR) repeat protein